MILVCTSCKKKYLFKGEPSKAPKCKCGGQTKPDGESGPDSQVADLKAQVRKLQKQLEDTQAAVGARERDLAQSKEEHAVLKLELDAAKGSGGGDGDAAKLIEEVKKRDETIHELQLQGEKLKSSLTDATITIEREIMRRKKAEAGSGGTPNSAALEMAVELEKKLAGFSTNLAGLRGQVGELRNMLGTPASPKPAAAPTPPPPTKKEEPAPEPPAAEQASPVPSLESAVQDQDDVAPLPDDDFGGDDTLLDFRVSKPEPKAEPGPEPGSVPSLKSAVSDQDDIAPLPDDIGGGDDTLLDFRIQKPTPKPEPPAQKVEAEVEEEAEDIAEPQLPEEMDETILDFGRLKKEMPKPAAGLTPQPTGPPAGHQPLNLPPVPPPTRSKSQPKKK